MAQYVAVRMAVTTVAVMAEHWVLTQVAEMDLSWGIYLFAKTA